MKLSSFFSKKALLFTIVLSFITCSICAQQLETIDEGPKKFEYKYKENDSYRILSTVEEDVFVNGTKHHSAEIVNRISVKVHDVNEEKMTAINEGTFMTTENSVMAFQANTKTFSYGEKYKSTFKCN